MAAPATAYARRWEAAAAACRTLFLEGAGTAPLTPVSGGAGDIAEECAALLELTVPGRPARPAAELRTADAESALNTMLRKYPGRNLPDLLAARLFEALAARGALAGNASEEETRFLLNEAAALLRFPAALASHLRKLRPALAEFLRGSGAFPDDPAALTAALAKFDPFAGGRAFHYHGGRFYPIVLDTIRPVDRFYGFPGMRKLFSTQFRDFAAGKPPVPLLIYSLPGHGKTQLTIAHALAHDNLTLVTADEEVLSHQLPELIAALKRRPDRRFVVFFDDLDPDRVDWYDFRTQVGGAFTPPDHILLALASNYEFPPSILSRGCSIHFPTFDDVRCMEMVEDFLASVGFRHTNRNLVSLIATGYTEDFGQKLFSELSPRTLVRYLAKYDSPVRRRDAVRIACGQVIPRPDAQLFYEFNIRLMRRLYGNEYIDELRRDRLRELE